MAANIERLMEPGATIYVSVPWIWRAHSYPDDYFRVSMSGVVSLFAGVNWSALRFVTDKILKTSHVDAITIDGHPYLARAETCGFGVRR